MSGGGNQRANGERGAESSMDDYLKSLGLHRKSIAKDGSCLFRAVAEQVLFSQSLHSRVRAQCVEFLREHRGDYEAFIEGDYEDYLCKIQDPKQWVGEVEINALSIMYKRDFLIFQEPGKPAVNITGYKYDEKVQLCFLNGNHYDSVYPITQMKNAALCQSILYELLYEKVFAVERDTLGRCLRSNRATQLVSDDNMPPCVSSEDSDAEVSEAPKGEKDTVNAAVKLGGQSWRGRGRGRLPERVRRSLNPTLFRNVEYDVWQKSLKAQQKRDFCIAAGMQYAVGDRCQADVEGHGRYCNATIKEVHADAGQVTVETEKFGQVRLSLRNLQSCSAQNTGLKAVPREKKPINGHDGEWEERRRGRGRGRGSTASSVSSAAAPGSVGRTVKQHSWPGQAASEDRGGHRVTRLSGSEAESLSFGLTEKERLEREEAEKNVALVELHLRDENSFPALTGNGTSKNSGERKQSQRRNVKSPVESPQAALADDEHKSSSPPISTAPVSANKKHSPSLDRDEKPPNWPDSIKVVTPSMAASTTPSPFSPVGAAPVSDPKASEASRITKAVSSSPVFIAPIAPDPATALGFHRSSSRPHSPLPLAPSPPVLVSSSSEGLPSKVTCGASASPLITSSSKAADVVQSHAESRRPSPPPQTQTMAPVVQSGPALLVQASVVQAQSEGKPFLHLSADQKLQSPSLVSPNQNLPPMLPGPTQSPASLAPTQLPADVQPLDTQKHPLHQPQGEVEGPQNQIAVSQGPPSVLQSPDPVEQPHLQLAANSPPPAASRHSEASLAHTTADGQASDPSPPEQPYQSQMAPVLAQAIQSAPGSTSAPVPMEPNQTPPVLPPVQGTQPFPQMPAALPLLSHPDVQGGVPLQQLSQIYQDPLYPGFPQEPNGNMASIPPFSSMKSGEDLPRDVNILRFFFNLGVKAFKNPMYQPCVYLLPLQQAFNLHLNSSSNAGYQPAIPPAEHQGAYQPQPFISEPQYRPQFPSQSLPVEPSNPSESARYPINQPPAHAVQGSLLPWQPPQPKRQLSPGYTAGYMTQSQYPDPSPQVYQRGGPVVYPPVMPSYTPPSHSYPPPNTPGEAQAAEQSHQMNGAMIPGPGHSPASGPLEISAARFHPVDPHAMKTEQSGMRVLHVEPPFEHHRKPPPVSFPDVTMATIPRSNAPNYFLTDKSATLERHSFPHPPTKAYTSLKAQQGGARMNSMPGGFSSEENWCQPGGVTSMTWSNQTTRRGPRSKGGRRGRGGAWRGDRGSGYTQFNAYPGRGQDRE